MSLLSDQLEGSRCPWRGRQCGEAGAHMEINLPIFTDDDAKDAVTYQIWRWDLTVQHHTGCQDHMLLPICHLVLARLPQRVSVELWDGYNLGQCVNNPE